MTERGRPRPARQASPSHLAETARQTSPGPLWRVPGRMSLGPLAPKPSVEAARGPDSQPSPSLLPFTQRHYTASPHGVSSIAGRQGRDGAKQNQGTGLHTNFEVGERSAARTRRNKTVRYCEEHKGGTMSLQATSGAHSRNFLLVAERAAYIRRSRKEATYALHAANG